LRVPQAKRGSAVGFLHQSVTVGQRENLLLQQVAKGRDRGLIGDLDRYQFDAGKPVHGQHIA